MLIPVLSAVVKNNELRYLSPGKYKAVLAMVEGREVDVIIKKHTYTRTLAENRYYWGVVVKLVSDEMGEAQPLETHALLKSLFLIKGGELTHGGKVYRYQVVRDTHDLTIGEFEDYLTKCRDWASQELNVVIPLPNEISLEDIQ